MTDNETMAECPLAESLRSFIKHQIERGRIDAMSAARWDCDMDLDSAIAHAREVEELGGRCGEEHGKLAAWLEELRELREAERCLLGRFRSLKTESGLSPEGYAKARGFDVCGKTCEQLRVDMLNDIVDRYEELVGGFLGSIER